MPYTINDWLDGRLEAHFRVRDPEAKEGEGGEYVNLWLPVSIEALASELRSVLEVRTSEGREFADFLRVMQTRPADRRKAGE